MATKLIIYNSGNTGTQILSYNTALYTHPDAELKDLNTVAKADIDTWIGTLTDDNYIGIYICCDTAAVAGGGATDGKIDYDQLALLDSKMATAYKGTSVVTGTCQVNAVTTSILLATTASAVNHTYRYMFVKTAGTTAVYRYISAYTGATRTCTVTDTGVAVTNVDTYVVYTNTYIYAYGDTAVTGKTAAYRYWQLLYPDTTPPAIVSYLGGYKYAYATGTPTAVGASSITLAVAPATGDIATVAQHATDDFYKDKFVYIRAATYGAGQVRKITGYDGTTRVATLDAAWTVDPYMIAGGVTVPTTSVEYSILDEPQANTRTLTEEQYPWLLADKAADIACRMYLWDPTSANAKAIVKLLIDRNGSLANSPAATTTDWIFMWGDFLKCGKAAFRANAYNIV
jgi:hypothetical protein